MSAAFDLSCGLKQGAVYSPLLFAIYFNFITTACKRKFQEKKLGVTIRLRKETKAQRKEDHVMVQNKNGSIVTIFSLEYADDVDLEALSLEDLQEMVTVFGDMCKAFGMKVSGAKTVVMAVKHVTTAKKKDKEGTGAAAEAELGGDGSHEHEALARRVETDEDTEEPVPDEDSETDDDWSDGGRDDESDGDWPFDAGLLEGEGDFDAGFLDGEGAGAGAAGVIADPSDDDPDDEGAPDGGSDSDEAELDEIGPDDEEDSDDDESDGEGSCVL
jgi:hypothetical protein